MALNKRGHMGIWRGLGSPLFGNYAPGVTLGSIFSKYSFTNMWSAENITDGANLTVHDYAEEHDLSSSGYTKPTINTSDSNFGGKQSLSFVSASTQGISKAVANWRGGDNVGMVTEIMLPKDADYFGLNSSDNALSNEQWGVLVRSTNDIFRVLGSATLQRVTNEARSIFQVYPVFIKTIISTGSAYNIVINGIEQPVDMTSGANNGRWIDAIPNRDDISIGMVLDNVPDYGTMDWALSGYHSTNESIADVIAMHQDFMSYYGMTIPLAISQLDQLNGIVNGWNYNHLTVDGTTTYAFDLKGQYDMSNPAASNQPTLNADHLYFNGTNDYLYNGVADYLSGNTTGVLHALYSVDTVFIPFSSNDEALSGEEFITQSLNTGGARLRVRTSSVNYDTDTTDTWSGYKVVSYVQDGTALKIFIDGVKIADYDVEDTGTRWIDDVVDRDNIVIGARIRSLPIYSEGNWKASFYMDYVDDATVSSEATTILNSGL